MYAKKAADVAPSKFDFDLAVKGVKKNEQFMLRSDTFNCSDCVIMIEIDGYDQLKNTPHDVTVNLELHYVNDEEETGLADIADEADDAFGKVMVASFVAAVILAILVVVKKRRAGERKEPTEVVPADAEEHGIYGPTHTLNESNSLV